MERVIGSVVLGYLVIFVIVFATFSLTFLAMGPERAFRAWPSQR